jgi:CRP-like cAMP-binding protein
VGCHTVGRWQSGAQCEVERGKKASKAENHLIAVLPRRERKRLQAICEPVELVLADVVALSGQPVTHVYFPVDGFISLVTLVDGKPILEVGMVGREGMVGVEVALGVLIAPMHAVVQGAGLARRIAVGAFRRELANNAPLQRCLNRYLYVRMTQLALAATCLRFHLIEPRLARWLLMTQDRAHVERFRVTHEFLAYMLGVRRVGVTTAAGALQRRGLIQYSRGQVSVVDRAGLEAASCSCYAGDIRSYDAVI